MSEAKRVLKKGEKKKRGPNMWNQALKQYNEKSGKEWCIPKKGTKEYQKVRNIYNRMKKKTARGKKDD